MDVQEQARRLWNAALDLLFPPRCAICRREGTLLCSPCVTTFPFVPEPCCPVCGLPVDTPAPCSKCQGQNRRFESVKSAFLYVGSVREAIHAFKYFGRRQLASPLASGMAAKLRASVDSASYLCAVPLHPDREKSRGYNQSALLTQQLAHYLDLPALPPSALIRTRNTVKQVDLGFAERQSNLLDAFAASQEAVNGRAILLVDDVCTTGATLTACASALLDAGATSVKAITLARAV